jgi:hypothetical protein
VCEHRIRLRGGWEARQEDSPLHAAYRLTLPTHWEPLAQGRIWLLRRFGRPPCEDRSQVIWLELERVSGTTSIELNGHPLVAAQAQTSHYHVRLDALPARNRLILLVDLDDPAARKSQAWGEISLVIKSAPPL